MNKKEIEMAIDHELHVEVPMDGFFGRIRKCPFCHTKGDFDMKKGVRYCPKGCFHGNKISKDAKRND